MKQLATAGEAEVPVLKAALLGYPGPLVVPEAARLLDSAAPPVKAALVEVLGEKGASGEIERVFRLAEDLDPAVREASLKALGQLAGDADLPRLVAMLERAGETNDVVRLREGIAATVRRNPDREHRTDTLLGLLKAAAPAGKLAILQVLPRVGGATALRAVVEETASPDSQVQPAAVAALARWPEMAAADELLRLASTKPEHFRAAAQGYVRLVGRSEMEPAKKLDAFQKLLALPAEDADRRPVLAGVAGARDPVRCGSSRGTWTTPPCGTPPPRAFSTSPPGSSRTSAGSPATRRTRCSGASRRPSPIRRRRRGPARSSSTG